MILPQIVCLRCHTDSNLVNGILNFPQLIHNLQIIVIIIFSFLALNEETICKLFPIGPYAGFHSAEEVPISLIVGSFCKSRAL
jgi:hypothetical protein